MRVIHDQPGVVVLRQRKQLGQRCQVAVHAEHRVGDNQLHWRRAVGEARFEQIEPAVRIAPHLRVSEQPAVDQRGVVELVGEDRRLARAVLRSQRGEQRKVGHVTGAKAQRVATGNARREEIGQIGFERRMRAAMAADQVRRAAARPPESRTVRQRVDHLRMAGEPEIVIAAERHQVVHGTIRRRHALMRGACAFGGAPPAPQRRGLALTQPAVQECEQHGSRCPASV
jgi:hypothetical protein